MQEVVLGSRATASVVIVVFCIDEVRSWKVEVVQDAGTRSVQRGTQTVGVAQHISGG